MPQSYSVLWFHIIFATKQRHPMIPRSQEQCLYDYMGGILRDLKGTLVSAGGTADHIHLLAILHRDTSVARAVRETKSGSSRWLNETHPDSGRFRWQDGYSAFTVGRSEIAGTKVYIADQEEHHRTMSYLEEVRKFLDQYGVEYDKRWLREG